MSYNSAYQGYGGGVTGGGANPEVVTVTSLGASGVGTLREAFGVTPGVGKTGVRIEFGIGGQINVGNSRIDTSQNNITIAGETAPDKGVEIIGGSALTQAPIRFSHNNYDVRYIRFRPGVSSSTPDGVQMNGCNGMMFHHCEFMFGTDENVDISQNTQQNITLQWCIIAYGLAAPGTSLGFLMANNTLNVSIHHCLFAHNHGRNPRPNCAGPVQMINNIIYNLGDHPMTTEAITNLDLVGNVCIMGPDTLSTRTYIVATNAANGGTIYYTDNIQTGTTIRASDLGKYTVSGTPLASPSVAVHTIPSQWVLGYVLPYVGAILPVRDSLSQRVVDDVWAGSGAIINAPSEAGGYPNLTTSKSYKITSHKTVTGTSLNMLRVEYYNGITKVHTADHVIGKSTQRSWNSGAVTVNINKRQAIIDSIRRFAVKNNSTLLVLPETSDLSTLPTDSSDPNGWIADPEVAALVGETRALF